MNVRSLALLLVGVFVACGPTVEPQTNSSTNSSAPNAATDGTNNAAVGARYAGIYEGTPRGGPVSEVTLAIWDDDETTSGRLVADGDRAYRFDLDGDTASLSAIDGACVACTSGETWDVDVTPTALGLRLAVDDPDATIGFSGVDFVPHDGFKPESAPAPGAQLWAGPVIAVDPTIASHPVLDSDCELWVDAESLATFSCVEATESSPWEAAVNSSWTEDAAKRSWMLESGDARIGFLGTVEAGQPPIMRGEVLRLEAGEEPMSYTGVVIGRFMLVR